MYRTASSRVRALKGCKCSWSPSRFPSSGAVGTQSSSAGFFSWLGDGPKSPTLDTPLPGVVLPPALPDHVEPGKMKVTTLANGLKIASETSAHPAASIGLYVKSGSVYESPDTLGVSHLLERMAFRSTMNRSHLRVVRESEAIGSNIQASASREQMIYTIDALKNYVPEMVELLVDCVRNPAFLGWDVNEVLEKMQAEISEAASNPQGLLLEAIHSAGFSGALSNPLLAPESAISRMDDKVLEQFVAEHYTAPRIVLAASGVEHEELLSVAEPLLSDLPKIGFPGEPKSVYTGGEYRQHSNSEGEKAHFALAFELPGGWSNPVDAMTLSVLQMLLGGGGSFSVGGPGKGMYSRLYLHVLNEYQQVESLSAFSSFYNQTSIFGIHGTTSSDFVSKAMDLAAFELEAVAKSSGVDAKELHRAKQATKSGILMTLESRANASEDIGRQVLTYGERKPVQYFLDLVDAVKVKDIADIVKKLVSSPLTMASYGNVRYVPTYDSVSAKFRSK